MTKEEIVKKLKIDNQQLDSFSEKYFASKIQEPKLGITSFEYIENVFYSYFREFSIVDSKVIKPQVQPTLKVLLQLNEVSESTFEIYKEKVNNILLSYTDNHLNDGGKSDLLQRQIHSIKFNDDNSIVSNIYSNISSILCSDSWVDNSKERYILNLTNAMKEAGINQIKSGRYMIIDELFNKLELLQSIKYNSFKDKKKYLRQLAFDKAIVCLDKYVENILTNNEDKNPLDTVKQFFYYLVYDKNKVDIYLINSVLGYNYQEGAMVYKKLLLKDKSTGKNKSFLLHTDIENITKDELHSESFLYNQIVKILKKEVFDI